MELYIGLIVIALLIATIILLAVMLKKQKCAA